MTHSDENRALFEAIGTIINEKIPFNKLLGLQLESLSFERVSVKLGMRDNLIGNYMRGALHGGVISSVIDLTGGLAAFMGLLKRLKGRTLDEKIAQFGKLGTIDLRVDYLRPGLGKWFICSGYTLRTGNKVAVARLELRNDTDNLIAVGTGSYVVA
jgi:uncharacterized protein (TIGR00369 family)